LRALRRIRSEKIGMVFQSVALLPHLSVQENVALPLRLRGVTAQRRAEVARAKLDLVGLSDWHGRDIAELSGGMQQRVGLARALAADPPILLMDEPFSALDPLIRRQLQDEFVRLSRELQKTVVFVTHDIDEALRVGHRIAIMRDGVIVQLDTPSGILMTPADSYVAQFVAGVHRLSVLRARDIMKPMTGKGREPRLPGAGLDDDLNSVVNLALGHAGEIDVLDEGGAVVGSIDQMSLLHAIRG
jgi:glycine betaine/proline transport system ATP-binding protein